MGARSGEPEEALKFAEKGDLGGIVGEERAIGGAKAEAAGGVDAEEVAGHGRGLAGDGEGDEARLGPGPVEVGGDAGKLAGEEGFPAFGDGVENEGGEIVEIAAFEVDEVG